MIAHTYSFGIHSCPPSLRFSFKSICICLCSYCSILLVSLFVIFAFRICHTPLYIPRILLLLGWTPSSSNTALIPYTARVSHDISGQWFVIFHLFTLSCYLYPFAILISRITCHPDFGILVNICDILDSSTFVFFFCLYTVFHRWLAFHASLNFSVLVLLPYVAYYFFFV